MRAPRVTVVMPVYQSRPENFHKTFPALLGQTFGDFELILSDNGSGDEARAMYEAAAATDSRVRLLRHAHNYGAALNFNYAFAQARGEYFMWSADDDVRSTEYLARTVERLDRSPQAASVGTGVVLVDGHGTRIDAVRFDARFALPRASQRVPVHGPVTAGDFLDVYALHRRAALAKTHLNQAIHGADVLLVRELLLQGTIERVEEELFFYRVPASYTLDSLAVAMLGGQAKTLLFRHPVEHLALQMIVAVATNDVSISDAERTACMAALVTSLFKQGWLTAERYTQLRARAGEAWRSRKYAEAAATMAQAFVRAPDRVVSADTWKRIVRRIGGLSRA